MKGMNLVTKKEYASIEYNTDSLLGLCPRFLQVSPKMCCRIFDLNLRPDNQRGRITRQIPNPKMNGSSFPSFVLSMAFLSLNIFRCV